MLLHVAPQIQPVDGILLNPMYQHLFSVDRVDDLVKSGMPFRDAYRQVAQEIKEGAVMHAPEASANDAQAALGSVGNVGIGELRKRLL